MAVFLLHRFPCSQQAISASNFCRSHSQLSSDSLKLIQMKKCVSWGVAKILKNILCIVAQFSTKSFTGWAEKEYTIKQQKMRAGTWQPFGLENKRKSSKSSLLFLLVSYFIGAAEEREDIIFVHCSISLLADSSELLVRSDSGGKFC